MPGAAFTVKNDSGLVITDLHLQIKDPLPAGSRYIIKFRPPPAPAGSIMSVGITANPAADCVPGVRCINQPDAKWTTPNSNIFDKFPLTNNDRTVDFTDPKTRMV